MLSKRDLNCHWFYCCKQRNGQKKVKNNDAPQGVMQHNSHYECQRGLKKRPQDSFFYFPLIALHIIGSNNLPPPVQRLGIPRPERTCQRGINSSSKKQHLSHTHTKYLQQVQHHSSSFLGQGKTSTALIFHLLFSRAAANAHAAGRELCAKNN